MRFRSLFTRGFTLACALTPACAPTALAAAGTGENTPLHLTATSVHHAASSSGSTILRTIVALVLVIAVIYVIARILRAVKGGGDTAASGDGLTRLATLPLAPGRSVALVRSGSDVVLVGVGESGVTPIKTYTEAEAVANGLISPYEDPATAPPAPTRRLLDTLRQMTVRT